MAQRLDILDFLKGIAIIGVVLAHFSIFYPSPSSVTSILCISGSRCPQLLYLISAFLTWYSLDKKDIKWLIFWKTRFQRIAPLFYVALLLTGLFPRIKLHEYDALNIITHFSFTNGLFPSYINSLMGVEWYIADLSLFYLLCPLLRKVAYDINSTTICLIASVLFNMLFTITTNKIFALQIATNEHYETYFHTFCIVNQMPILILGILLYYCFKQRNEKPDMIKRILWIFVVVTCIITGAFISFHLNKVFLTSSLIAGLIFFCITLLNLMASTIYMGGGGEFQV